LGCASARKIRVVSPLRNTAHRRDPREQAHGREPAPLRSRRFDTTRTQSGNAR
jgi:hypothetical protein